MGESTAKAGGAPRLPGAIVGEVGWEAVLDAMPDPFIVLKPVRDAAQQVVDFEYAEANAAACAFYGLPPGELAGRTVLDLHPVGAETGPLKAYVHILDTREPMLVDDYSHPQQMPGGVIRHYDVRAVALDGCIAQTWRDVTDRYLARQELRAERVRYESALEAFQEPFITYVPVRDEAGRVSDLEYTYLNSAAERVLGTPAREVVGQRLSVLFPSAVDRGILDAYLEVFETERPAVIEVAEFDERDVHGSFELSVYPFGEEVIVIARDVTDRVAARAHLEESEQRFRLLAENAMDLVFSLDMHAIIDWVSPSVTSLLGYTPAELHGQFGGILIQPDDLPLLLDAANEARNGHASSCRIRLMTKPGTPRWVEAVPRPLLDKDGGITGGVIGVRDIQDEVDAQADYAHAMTFDSLTGLARRALGLDRIQDILDSRAAPGWALLCVGVDGLTAINQAFTHGTGDAVLIAVADRLISACGADDRVARIAGDEFAVLMRDIVTPEDAAEAAARIIDAVSGSMSIAGGEVGISVSVGISMARGQTAEELLRDATAAMRQAGRRGAGNWAFLAGDVQAKTRRVLSLRSALNDAIEDGQIRPWFMPIVSLADGMIEGYEALARWQRPDGEIVSPEEFIGIIEGTPAIVALDRRILRAALAVISRRPEHLHVGVNTSSTTLSQASLAQWVKEELARSGVDPARLHLEVTETTVFEISDIVRKVMDSITELGVTWWVDDFGTGYSSVSHLRDLPISGLKLDRSFTDGITEVSGNRYRIAHGLAGLASGLGLVTIAEGVETREQADVLAAQGWDYGQGWFFGKPTPADS